MAKLLLTCLMILSRRPAVLVLAAVAVLSSAGNVKAGVIVPCAQAPATVAAVDFNIDAAAGPSKSDESVPAGPAQRDGGSDLNRLKALDGLVPTDGGASAPVPNSIGSVFNTPAVICDAAAIPLATRSFGYLRESAPQLPQPFAGELLDPPKPCT